MPVYISDPVFLQAIGHMTIAYRDVEDILEDSIAGFLVARDEDVRILTTGMGLNRLVEVCFKLYQRKLLDTDPFPDELKTLRNDLGKAAATRNTRVHSYTVVAAPGVVMKVDHKATRQGSLPSPEMVKASHVLELVTELKRLRKEVIRRLRKPARRWEDETRTRREDFLSG